MAKKTIVGELKDLFVKFGGNPDTLTGKETTAEMLDAIEKVYTDKGDTLPEVTAEDNGDVLTVVNGEWDKAELPNNDYVVTYTEVDGEDETTIWECDATLPDIDQAIADGKNVRAVIHSINGTLSTATYVRNGVDDEIQFSATSLSGVVPMLFSIVHIFSGTIDEITFTQTALTAAT